MILKPESQQDFQGPIIYGIHSSNFLGFSILLIWVALENMIENSEMILVKL